MKKTDVIIIGAGASGLMAAYTLTKAGKTVTILDARNRTGGRIHTLTNELFFEHAETGAEFVHGNLPVTLKLIEEAGLTYHAAHGEMWQYLNGRFTQDEQMIAGWDELLEKLSQLRHDMPIHDFLQTHFAHDKYAGLRKSTERYVSGYDTADPKLASSLALLNEWQNEDEDAQYRIDGGYCRLISYMAETCKSAGNAIMLNTTVKEVLWKPGDVKVVAAGDTIFEAEKLIIALPLGVLQAPKDSQAFVHIHPAISQHQQVFNNIGFGAIIKVLLEFDEVFWEADDIRALAGHSLQGMEFLFTEEVIPTWWTQHPRRSALLTGWLGGVAAFEKKDMSNEDVLQLSLTSLSHVFKIAPAVLKDKLVAWHIANWTADPFTLGSYAYDKVGSDEARKVLDEPVEDTIYFAGEYLYNGPAMGTVEAALTSGKNVAERLIKFF